MPNTRETMIRAHAVIVARAATSRTQRGRDAAAAYAAALFAQINA